MGTGVKTTFSSRISEAKTTNADGLGEHRYEDGKWYKRVQANGAIAAGQALGYQGVTGYARNQVTADTSTAANRIIPAGVAPVAATDDQYLWVLIKGEYNITAARVGGSTDGVQQELSNTDGQLVDRAAGDVTALFGYAIDASAGLILVDCPW